MLGQTKLRAVLWPGLAFQRLTVARPGPLESLAGITALRAALAEHVKVQAERERVAMAAPRMAQMGAHPAE
ncbi:MAG: hypothetical protein JOZ41_13980 [Chloroflexi bacterium]|nr:hypothetical protein [Chloroflexota bacterium]